MPPKKKILLLTTGGTIASLPGGEGLEPQRSDVMERELEQLRTYYEITVRDVMCLDSSNIRPEEWQTIARSIFESREGFDGIVVALIGSSNPLGVVIAGIFYGALKYAGSKLNLIGAPSEVIKIITGTVVFFIAISHIFKIVQKRKAGKK